jgi:hypothetical protein
MFKIKRHSLHLITYSFESYGEQWIMQWQRWDGLLISGTILTFSFKFCWSVLTTSRNTQLPGGFEFITKLMHNFIYFIIILHHDPQHVSSISVLIFRRTTVYLQYLVSSHSVCCHTVHRLRADCIVIQDTCIILIQFYLGVLVLIYLFCLFCIA